MHSNLQLCFVKCILIGIKKKRVTNAYRSSQTNKWNFKVTSRHKRIPEFGLRCYVNLLRTDALPTFSFTIFFDLFTPLNSVFYRRNFKAHPNDSRNHFFVAIPLST